jgi:hypothetical protein
MIKTIFLSLFWSAILPVGFFITALAMLSVYLADKYNLLYQWRRPPALDSTLARRSRNFLIISILSHVILSRIFFAVRPLLTPPHQKTLRLLSWDSRSSTPRDPIFDTELALPVGRGGIELQLLCLQHAGRGRLDQTAEAPGQLLHPLWLCRHGNGRLDLLLRCH